MEGLETNPVLAVAILGFLVQKVKETLRVAGVKRDVAAPLVSMGLGVLYVHFIGDLPVSEAVEGGVGLGAVTSVIFKVLRAGSKLLV